jgi:general secretion pathway protein K
LLLVVWVLAILAVLAAGFAASTRSETRLARNLVESARARALAEAGVSRGLAALLDPDPRQQWRADGTPRELSFAGGTIRVRIEDEAGKIDLNRGPLEVLSALCAELGVDGGACVALADGIASRRRMMAPPPSLPPRAGRLELGLARGSGVGTMRELQAAAFGTIDELRLLPGVDLASVERLRPYLTVYSQGTHIDPSVAPREVLLAIPGVDPREVETLLAARATLAGQSLVALPPLTGVERFAADSQLRAATIVAQAATATGASFTRRAVIALTGLPLRPAQTLEWRQDLGSTEVEQP